jgi:hypothetical protein
MSAPHIERVSVPTADTMESAMLSYIARGYIVVNRSSKSTIMEKRKEFSVLLAILALALFVLPLVMYLVVYSLMPDSQIVQITCDS